MTKLTDQDVASIATTALKFAADRAELIAKTQDIHMDETAILGQADEAFEWIMKKVHRI
jgi:hypothetical protein